MLYVLLWVEKQEHTDQFSDFYLVGVYGSLEHAKAAAVARKGPWRTLCHYVIAPVPQLNKPMWWSFNGKRLISYEEAWELQQGKLSFPGVVPIDVAPGATVVVTQENSLTDIMTACLEVRGVFTDASIPRLAQDDGKDVFQWELSVARPDGYFLRKERERRAKAEAEYRPPPPRPSWLQMVGMGS